MGDTQLVDLVVRDRFGMLLVRMPIYVRLRLPDLSVVDMLVLPAEPREGAPLTVYAASSLEPVGDGVGATATALGVVVPVLLIVVTGTAWLLVGRTLKPVEAIRRRRGIGEPLRIVEPDTIPEALFAALKVAGAPYAYAAKAWAWAMSELPGIVSGRSPGR